DRPSLPDSPCAPTTSRIAMSFALDMLDSTSLGRPFGIRQTLIQALRPSPSARPCRPAVLLGNSREVAVRMLAGDCGPLGDTCGYPELARRDADEALEVMGELALVREAGPRGDLRQGEVVASLQELLRPVDAAREDELVRRQS